MLGSVSNTPFVSRPFAIEPSEQDLEDAWLRNQRTQQAPQEAYVATRLADGVDKPNSPQRFAVDAHSFEDGGLEVREAGKKKGPGEASGRDELDGLDLRLEMHKCPGCSRPQMLCTCVSDVIMRRMDPQFDANLAQSIDFQAEIEKVLGSIQLRA